MDVEKVLDFIEDMGCNVWLVNGGGILSFYPTRLEHQTRNPYLDRRPSGDLFGDAVEAGHRRGIRVMARMDFSKVNQAVADRHPDWLFVRPDGRRQAAEGQVSVDPSGDYYQEKLLEVVDEMIDRYPLDGFFFNRAGFNEFDYAMHYHGVSQSEASKRGFAAFSGGQQLPTGPESPNYDLWRAYCAKVVGDLWVRISAHIKTRRPDVALLRSDDVIFFEANNKMGRPFWPHHVNEQVSAYRTQRPDRPVLCHCVTFVDMPYRIASEQPEHFAQHQIQGLSRGANISAYIMGVPGEIEYPSLEVGREIMRFHRDNQDVYHGLVPAAHVGLVRPNMLAMSLDRHREAQEEFRGLYEALQQAHVPFDVVPAEGLDDMRANGGLGRYSVLVLADLGPLPAEAVTALDTFVERGGRLVVTGRSGFDAKDRAQLARMPAVRVTETTTDPDALKSVYVTERPVEEGRYYFAPLSPVFGAHLRVEAAPGAEGRLVFLPQAPYGPPEKCYGHAADGTPGFWLDASGKVALIPWTVGRSYHELGLTTLRDIIVDVTLSLLGDDEPVQADLEEHVEMTLQRRGSDLVVHLINLSGARRKNYGPPIRTRGGTLRLAGAADGTTARALISGSPCPAVRDGDALVFSLPELNRFEVLLIEAK
ncbi:alpha-amylase family protein [Chelativorans oligotrophicus]|nr:alpha-amylase family protein [Chelativorans oligotrophicus]